MYIRVLTVAHSELGPSQQNLNRRDIIRGRETRLIQHETRLIHTATNMMRRMIVVSSESTETSLPSASVGSQTPDTTVVIQSGSSSVEQHHGAVSDFDDTSSRNLTTSRQIATAVSPRLHISTPRTECLDAPVSLY